MYLKVYNMHRVLQDQGGRPYMEDTYFAIEDIVPGVHAYAVFDGHGGAQVAAFAREVFPKVLRELLPKSQSLGDILFVAFQLVVQMLPLNISMQTGCTAVVMLQRGNQFAVANAGDSRAIMNEGTRTVQITEDHKPDRELDRIYKSGGFVTHNEMDVPRVNGNLAVSRSIGDFYLFPSVTWKPDIYSFTTSPLNQYIILATDGLWDVVSSEEMVMLMNEQVHSSLPMNDAFDTCNAQSLVLSRKRGSTDNFTVLSVAIHSQ